jgi:hypothetical protein
VRVSIVPFFQVRRRAGSLLLLFSGSLPWLISLGAFFPVGSLPRIVVWGFFAHFVTSKGQPEARAPVPSRSGRFAWPPLESRFCGVEWSFEYAQVMADFGRHGRAWPETDVEATDLETVIADLLDGQYPNPVRVVGFNTAEKWSQDVSADVAAELRRRCDLQQRDIPFFLQDFTDRYEGRFPDIQLPLPLRLV